MIFFSDMDGTFLTTEKTVSETSRHALDAIAEAGFEFVPCTGRALTGIPAVVLDHPSVHYAVSSNGAAVYRLGPAGSRLEGAERIRLVPLSREAAHAVWDIAQAYDVTFDVFADNHSFLRRDLYDRLEDFVDDPYTLASMRAGRTPVDEEPDETIDRVHDLERLAMYWRDSDDRDRIVEAVGAIEGVALTRSYPMNIEVMDKDASKGTALDWLCRHLGIPASNAVAFGDNFNDIEMLRVAGTGVAMDNAEPETKAAADRVCAANDDGGVALTILELIQRA